MNKLSKKIITAVLGITIIFISPLLMGGIYFLHNDHLGTTQVITDSDKDVVWKARYSPFGEIEITNEIVSNNSRFPGQYQDESAGYIYNYRRDYDSGLGRYIQSDPIGLRDGVNTYLYVDANPLNYIDPKGEAGVIAVPPAIVVGGGVLVGCYLTGTCSQVMDACRDIYDGYRNESSDEDDTGKRHSPDQQSLNDLIDELTKGGRKPLSDSDADAILDWADELGIPGVRDDRGKNHWEGGEHIHIPGSGINHIPTGKDE